MASQFFGYDPYDPYRYFYTAAPSMYDYDPYYQRQPAAAAKSTSKATARKTRETKTSFSIPVHGPDSDPPEPVPPELKQKASGARAKPVEPPELKPVAPVMPSSSSSEAVVRVQAAARGFLARKSVRAVRDVQREAEQVGEKMVSDAAVALLIADSRARVAVGEALMRMLLRLDAVRGARDYRRRVIKRVLALQDAVDALETKLAPAPAPARVEDEAEADADAPGATTTVEMVEESTVEPEVPDAMQSGNETASIRTAVDMPTQVEVDDEAIAGGEPEAEDANVDVNEPEGSEADGEWEMVTEEENEHTAPMAATSDDQEPPRKEPAACLLETTTAASADAASNTVEVKKVMEMVTALYELSAKQCAMIGALAERVDALERTVRRMEDALKNTEAK